MSKEAYEFAKQSSPTRQNALTALCGSILLILAGGFWLLILQASLGDNSAALLPESSWMGLLVFLALLTGSTFSGGVITLYHSIQSLRGKTSHRLMLPSWWIWLFVWVAVLVSGYGVHSSELDSVVPVLGIILPLLAGFVPLVTLVAIGTQLLPVPVFALTWRRLFTALICGALVAFHIAGLLIILLDGQFEQRYHACVSPLCAGSPEGYSGFIFLALVIPLVEELVKPLALMLFMPKISGRTEALLLGMICGAGYGCIEGFIFILLFPTDWPFIAAISATFTLLHGLSSGWVMVGWYHLKHKSPARWLKTPGYWLIALLMHIAFNGSFAVFLLPGKASEVLKFGIEIGNISLDAVASSFVADLLLLSVYSLLTFWHAGALEGAGQLRTNVPAGTEQQISS